MISRCAVLLLVIEVMLGRPALPQDRASKRLLAPPLPYEVSEAFRYALAGIQEFGAPSLASNRGIAFQLVPDKKFDLTVLLAESPPGPEQMALPELCEARTADSLKGVIVCDYEGRCSEVPVDASPTIICNRQEWLRIAVVLSAIHGTRIIQRVGTSDWAYMDFVKRVTESPIEVLQEK